MQQLTILKEVRLLSHSHTRATVFIPKKGKSISRVMVNDKVVWKQGRLMGKPEGIRLYDDNAQFLSFVVQPGAWNFKAIWK